LPDEEKSYSRKLFNKAIVPLLVLNTRDNFTSNQIALAFSSDCNSMGGRSREHKNTSGSSP
jgi:hypothetical protein